MKKIIKALTVAGMLFAAVNVNAQNGTNENALIGKARGAAHECLKDATGDVNGGVEKTETGYVVNFWSSPNCPPNMMCPMYVIHVATVEFDSNGNVIAVNCGNNQI